MKAKGIILKLQNYQDNASDAEKNLLQILIKEPEKAFNRNVRELAELAYCSPATVVRLVKKLGCRGYGEFQKELIYETAIFRDSVKVSVDNFLPTDSTDRIIACVSKKNIESLEMSEKLVDPKAVEKCVDFIDSAYNINLFGVGSSLLVARDLYLKMIRVGKTCNICDDLHSQLLYAKTMKKEDLAFIVSYSGLTKEMIDCARTARQNGAHVVALTRAAGSLLADYADVVLTVAATELIIRSGAMSSRICQLNMVDIVYAAYVNRHYETCMDSFPKTQLFKAFDIHEN